MDVATDGTSDLHALEDSKARRLEHVGTGRRVNSAVAAAILPRVQSNP